MSGIKSICFLTGGVDRHPIGGYKVIYEYANRLVAKGWDVTSSYPMVQRGNTYPMLLLKHPTAVLALWQYYKSFRHGDESGGSWFPLDGRVKKIYPLQNSPSLARRFQSGTRFIATYFPTVFDLNRFAIPTTCKFNLIQDFEAWFGWTDEDVYKTYRYPMTKIAISNWLADKVSDAGSKAVVVPNGLDFTYFKMTNEIEDRKPMEIAMLWHVDDRKRTEDAVAALRIVQGRYPNLHVAAFGSQPKPSQLPVWITYYHRPDKETHNRIYNNAAIFVASSEQEGWGLTPCEAMICGAAVACTDIGGYRMFANDGETALMSRVRCPEDLADNICRLIEDDKLRCRIASKAHENIKQFTWERSFAKFESALQTEG